jgi:hypothetical protein
VVHTSEAVAIDWEDEGRQLAARLDGVSAAVIVGRDPVAAAKVALGIGRVQARRRRVAIGDLVGEVSALQALVPANEGHGLVDSFLYGVSLTRIAHPIDSAKNLYVLPSGMEPIDYDSILRSDRWSKLTSGFREVEALLLILVPARASGLEQLVESVDGAIVVGDERRSVPGKVLATVRPAALAAPDEREAAVADDALAAVFGGGNGRRTLLVAAATLLPLAAVAAVVWGTAFRSGDDSGDRVVPADSAPATVGTTDSAAGVAQPVASAPMADSAFAMAFGVELFKYSSFTETTAELDGAMRSGMPAVTFTPLIVGPDSARWYALVAGAFRDSIQAESLLASLRSRGFLPVNRGVAVRVPYALLVERGITAENAPGLVRAYHARGLPAYALRQVDGTATLFAGAFASPEDATSLLGMFRALGLEPTVVYRTGRIF